MVTYDFSNYNGKKVFLTGHTGFKGSWMLTWLNMVGATVLGYSLKPESPQDLFNQINGAQLCNSVFGDILDKKNLESHLLDFDPDFVFHFAAQPLVRLSYQEPSLTFAVNALGTAYLLDAVQKLKKKCVVVLITTDKVYENLEWHYPYREVDRLGGYDPYSASKACSELVVSSYRNSFFHTIQFGSHQKLLATARAGNVIGGGDWAKDRIIPDIIKSLENNQHIKLRNPNAVRPWQHVLEPLAGYLQLGKKLDEHGVQFSGAWNFGPEYNDNLTVKQLTEIAIHASGRELLVEDVSGAEAVHEAGLLKLDISKAVSELGWVPRMDARCAVNRTVTWYMNRYNTPAIELVKKDIEYFGTL